jgi:hypothetical protein
MVLAVPLSVVTVVGFFTLWRQQRFLVWCMASYVLALGAFFLFFTHMLIVRNALVFVPLTAIAFGAGAHTLYELARPRAIRWLVPLGLAAAVFYNIAWLWITADSIYHSEPAAYPGRLLDYMAARPNRDFWLSPAVVAKLNSLSPSRLACGEDGGTPPTGAGGIVFLASEPAWDQWLSNHLGFFDVTISSLEINYDYYPTWYGKNHENRIAVLSADNARAMKVSLEGYRSCRALP